MIALALLLTFGAFEPEPLLPGKPYALKGHTEAVVALAFSPDGTKLATAARDKTVKLWSLETGQVLWSVPGAQEQLSSLAFSGDGKRLAVGDVGLHLRVLDAASGKVLHELAHPDGVGEVALDADGALLVVAGLTDHGAAYELPSGKKRYDLRGRTARLSADGKTLFVVASSGTLSWLDPKTGKARKTVKLEKEAPVGTMAASGSAAASWIVGGLDVRTFDGTGKPGPVLKGPVADPDRRQARILGATLTPDGKHVAVTGGDGLLRLWSVEKAAVVTSWPIDKGGAVAISNDGAWIAVIDHTLVKLWKLPR